jgi:hypothetical protein
MLRRDRAVDTALCDEMQRVATRFDIHVERQLVPGVGIEPTYPFR